MTRKSVKPDISAIAESPRTLFFRWFAFTSILNLYLLHGALRRWHYATPPTSHAMAQVFFWAVAVNIAAGLMIGWFLIRQGWRNRVPLVLTLDAAIGLLPFLMGKVFIGQDEFRFRAFGTIYVVFLLLRLILGIAWASWNLPQSQLQPNASLYVFLIAFLVFGGCVPWIWLAGPPSGDEPAYLLLAHSLAFDHDFDVGDNYRHKDYIEQFPPPSPGGMRGYPYDKMQRDGIAYLPHEPHVVASYRGQLLLWHDVGLPLLIAPAYSVAKREGALFLMALLGALGAVAIFQIAIMLGATNLQALLTAAIFCFTSPFYLYVQTVIVEAPGAVAGLWIALQFFRYRKQPRDGYLLLAGTLIATMPWLIIRFWALAGPLFLVLNAWVLSREWGKWRTVIAKMSLLGLPSLISLAAFAVLDKQLFNTYLPNAGNLIWGRILPQFWNHPVLGFLGLIFDQSFGLIPTAPMFAAVIAGMIVLYRRDRWGFATLLLPALGYVPFVIRSRFWMGGWAPPARLMVVAAMIMVPSASLVLIRRTRWIVIALTAWSGLLSVVYTVNPYLRMPSLWHLDRKSTLVEALHDHIHTPFYSILSIFPDMLEASPSDWLRAWMWLVLFCCAAWWWANLSQTPTVSASLSLAEREGSVGVSATKQWP